VPVVSAVSTVEGVPDLAIGKTEAPLKTGLRVGLFFKNLMIPQHLPKRIFSRSPTPLERYCPLISGAKGERPQASPFWTMLLLEIGDI
jgi:hypothetical protein